MGTPIWRVRNRARYSLTATVAALALAAGVTPAVAQMPAGKGKPVSAWGKHDKAKAPKVKIGTNKAPTSQPEAKPSKKEAAWAKRQRQQQSAGQRQADASIMVYVPQGQGDVPWHNISNVRLTDSLVARVDYSTGNLMLAATDFDIAGVGQNLQLARTYNSLDAPFGSVSDPWWVGYERKLDTWFADSVVMYDRSGATVDFRANDDGSYDTPDGYSLDLVRNEDGTFTVTDRKSGRKQHFTAGGDLTKVTDRNDGQITVTQHDGGGFKLTEERTGRWIDLTKTTDTRWEATDNAGRTATYTLDATGNLAATTDTAGETTLFDYDDSGRVTQVTTPEGRRTAFTYDDHSRVTSMKRLAYGNDGPTWTYTYSGEWPLDAGTTTVADPDEDETVYHHNDDAEVEKVTDPLGHERSSTFDAQHNMVTAVDAMGTGTTPGNTTTYGWDSRNNLTSASLPTGATTSLTGYQTIAGADLPGTITSPDGEKTSFSYDASGNPLSVAVSGDEGGTRHYTYQDSDTDCGGFEGQRCTAEDATGNKTSFTYDSKGNLTKVAPPSPKGPTRYDYDALGRPFMVTDGRGTRVTYDYDERDRVTKTDTAGYDAVTFTYDGDGNITSRTDRSGTVTYTYDALGRETIRTLQDGSQTVMAYTADSGNLDYYTDPQGTIDYTYDAANRLTKLTDPQGKATTYEYNANDTRTQTSYPGGTVQTVTLDDSDRPTHIKATSPAGTLIDLTYDYSYTVNGQTVDGIKIRSRTDAVADLKRTYTYDSAGRFSYAKETSGSTKKNSWQYCYDAAGNLTSQGITEGCPRGTTYTVNDASQITAKNGSTANWSYDKAGNETAGAPTASTTRTGEKYSEYSQLTDITVDGTTYTAQYGGTTNADRVRFGQTTFHRGPLGLAATTTAGTDTGFVREPAGTLNSVTRDGKSYYYLTDAIGTVVALTDASGNKVNSYYYSPRGVTVPTEKITQPYRYAGAYQDPTGLYKMGARYYDTRTGRFTQPDPSGQETNPYLYAAGDFINHTDPTGLSFWSTVGDIGHELGMDFYGCVSGVSVAAGTGVLEAASLFGPEMTVAAGGAACLAGMWAAKNGALVPTYG